MIEPEWMGNRMRSQFLPYCGLLSAAFMLASCQDVENVGVQNLCDTQIEARASDSSEDFINWDAVDTAQIVYLRSTIVDPNFIYLETRTGEEGQVVESQIPREVWQDWVVIDREDKGDISVLIPISGDYCPS